MDSGKGRKRPWEEYSPIDSQFKRRDLSADAPTIEDQPPPPQHARQHFRDSDSLNHRRLPPLYTPSCSASAEPLTTSSLHLSTSSQYLASGLKPRSQSLFDVSHQPPGPWHEGAQARTRTTSPALERDRSPPSTGGKAPRPRVGTDPAPHAAGGGICCPSDCQGQECSKARALMRRLATELVLLDSRVRSLSRKEYHPSTESPDFEVITIKDSLQWALTLVKWANHDLRDNDEHSEPRSPTHSLPQPDTSSNMRRVQHPYGQREEQTPPMRQYTAAHHGYAGFPHPGPTSDQSRGNHHSSDMQIMANSPHLTASSSGSMFMHPHSPMQAPQPSRPGMPPSPSSMNFPNVPNLPPISPPSTAVPSSAQASHLQDLQHQISVKTLAFQTLQKEYDSLLQKLERQRTKCATLEKKFEVSDVEINSLTDEKETLQAQVAALESQAEDLQQSRDETRRQLVSSGGQYMRIMEMANRLQAQSAEDKKRWEAERGELQQRIKVLEEAMVTGIAHDEHTSASPPPTANLARSSSKMPADSSSETINVLRGEVSRLRIRTQSLESALQALRQESVTIQEAAKRLVESGNNIEMATEGVLG